LSCAQSTNEDKVIHLSKEQETNPAHFRDAVSGAELETVDKEPLVEWMANNYKQFGCNLEFVTDRSGEGTQFVKGFGGIGGILRWKVDFTELNSYEDAAKLDKGDHSDDESEEDAAEEYGFDDGDYGF
jgi:peptide chain release factor subunit 1